LLTAKQGTVNNMYFAVTKSIARAVSHL